MKIPRDVSGTHLADTLCRRWQYTKVHQAGSHIILETSEPAHQRIAIPDHNPLRLGTFISILRSVAQHKGVRRDAISSRVCSASPDYCLFLRFQDEVFAHCRRDVS
jgi:hypothetical protein